MGTTPKYLWPYPELTDPPDGPAQIKALALAIDDTINKGTPVQQCGEVTITITADVVGSKSVTFPRAFPSKPVVVTNMSSGGTPSIGHIPKAELITTTSCNIYTRTTSAAGTWSPIVQWLGMTAATTPLAVTGRTAAPEGFHYVTATCRNDECPKNGEPVGDILVPDDPVSYGWTGIECGACGQPITDIVPAP